MQVFIFSLKMLLDLLSYIYIVLFLKFSGHLRYRKSFEELDFCFILVEASRPNQALVTIFSLTYSGDRMHFQGETLGSVNTCFV